MPDKLAAVQAVFFIALLCAASVFDLRRRIIPDTISLAIAATSLLCFSWGNLCGIAVAVPFLLAAVFFGGMGGGDIKLMAACGLVLGLTKGLLATVVGLALLLLYPAAASRGGTAAAGGERKTGNVPQTFQKILLHRLP